MIALPGKLEAQNQARPDWIDEALMRETKAVWEPLYGRCLTDSEVLEILLSVGRLIDALQEPGP